MRERRQARKEKPAACPFCEARVPRPKDLDELGETTGGHCACGAIYLADLTGKEGGRALMTGLTMLCNGDVDRALDLELGVDYSLEKMPYRPRTHSIEPRTPKHGGFGKAKLWFLRSLKGTGSSAAEGGSD